MINTRSFGFFALLFTPVLAYAVDKQVIPDLDKDGIADTVIATHTDHCDQLQVWISSRGTDKSRPADIVIPELFKDQVTAFDQIGRTEDVDGDGVFEITTLSKVVDSLSGQLVPVLSTYSSQTGLPIVTFFGAGAETLFLVLEGRAVGVPVDHLLQTIPQSVDTRAGFGITRLATASSSSGTSDTSDNSSPSGPGSWFDKGIQIPRIVFTLWEFDPHSWSWNIGRFIAIPEIAKSSANKRFPNDAGKNNVLRHAMWQFLLTCQFSDERAKKTGDIHEDASNDPCDTAVDQYNNQRARDLAKTLQCKPYTGDTILQQDLDALEEQLILEIEKNEFISTPTDPRVSPPCNEDEP